jgi:outer membrane protein assembly factor BamB
MIAALVVLGLLAGGGLFLWGGNDDAHDEQDGKVSGHPTADATPRPKNAMTREWHTSSVGIGSQKDAIVGRLGLWPSASTLTHVTQGGVRGYDIATGKEKWVARPPKGAGTPCAGSAEVNDSGVGAVMYRHAAAAAADADADTDAANGRSGNCSVVAAIDTRTGDVLWSKDLTDPEEPASASAVEVTVGAKTVAVNLRAGRAVHRYSAADGDELSALKPPEKVACEDPRMVHSAVSVVSLADCDDPDNAGRMTVYDTDTGRVRWSTPVKSHRDLFAGEVVADRPLTLYAAASSTLRTYSSRGELRHSIPMKGADAQGSTISLQDGHLVGGSVLVTRVVAEGEGLDGDSYAGYDLNTGARLWKRVLPEGARLLGVEHGSVLAVSSASRTPYRYELSKIGLRDGKVSPEGVAPVGDDDQADGVTAGIPIALAWDERRLYFSVRSGTDKPRTHLLAYRRNP